MALRFIVTGGTFDKRYDELKGELNFKESHLPAILKAARVTLPVEVEINQLIDSLHMTENDRMRILDACAAALESHIVVIHGTDTMVQTARVLGNARLEKTIVLTGAMIPYSVYGSDSLFNLGCAAAAAQLCPRGVFITMNGRIFPWDTVRKNTDLGIFEAL